MHQPCLLFILSFNRRSAAVPLHQAAQEAPSLARLIELARDSAQRLKAVETLIPPALRGAVRAGPIDGTEWCLLVEGNSAAAKLRQLLPALVSKLNRQGWEVTAIRLRVGSGQK